MTKKKEKNDNEKLMDGIEYENLIDKLPRNKAGKKWGKRRIDDINKIIVHQSLSDGKLESINNYSISPGNHISPSSGCPHLPYHIAIKKDGTVCLCNNFDDYTWHTKRQNRIGLSICVLGNFIGTGWNKGHEPTENQIESLDQLLNVLITNLKLGVKDIYGHYHYGKPACPGKAITSLIEEKRIGKQVNTCNRLDTVKDIQQALLLLGFELPKYKDDGIMGTETKKAIVGFQIRFNMPITGIADEKTRSLMIKVMSERGI
jgi:peptidoglycan hydrolase-like protein with peptidoglycan-binding domain